MFIQKIDPQGKLQWAHAIGGSEPDDMRDMFVDDSGYTYLTGTFKGTVDFNPGAALASFTSKGEEDIFLLKLNPDGTLNRIQTLGGQLYDWPSAIQVDDRGNIYLAGNFYGTVDFDPDTGSYELTSASGNAFLLKLDAQGQFKWVKTWHDQSPIRANALKINGQNEIFLNGTFYGTMDIDPGTGTDTLISSGLTDCFVLKLDSTGNFLWAHSWGNNLNDKFKTGAGLHLDGQDCYVVNEFQGILQIEQDSSSTEIRSAGGSDILLQKLDSSGRLAWVKSFGGYEFDGIEAMEIGSAHEVYLLGTFFFELDADPSDETYLLKNNKADLGIYLNELDSNGSFVRAHLFGYNDFDNPSEMHINQMGTIYWTGKYRDSIDIDPGASVHVLQKSPGQFEAPFLAKFSTCDVGVVDTSLLRMDSSLEATAVNAKFQWLFCENGHQVLEGDTSRILAPEITGRYAVKISQNGCTAITSCNLLEIKNALGTENIQYSEGLLIYPNPFETTIQIDFNSRSVEEVRIFDLNGRQLIKLSTNDLETVTVDLDVPAGTYILETVEHGIQEQHKLIRR